MRKGSRIASIFGELVLGGALLGVTAVVLGGARPIVGFAASQPTLGTAAQFAVLAGTTLNTTGALARTAPTTPSTQPAATTPTADLTGQDLGAMTLNPGVYSFSSSAQLTGVLTLSGDGVYIFQ